MIERQGCLVLSKKKELIDWIIDPKDFSRTQESLECCDFDLYSVAHGIDTIGSGNVANQFGVRWTWLQCSTERHRAIAPGKAHFQH